MNINYNCLLLNKFYAPIFIISPRKAISLVYTGTGFALDQNLLAVRGGWNDWVEYSNLPETINGDYQFFRSVSLNVAIPDIILLKNYGGIPIKEGIKYSRDNVFHRDMHNGILKCAYCGKTLKISDASIDHIIPKSRIINYNSWLNCITSCKKCNEKKANKTPVEAGMKLLYKPTEPKWRTSVGKIVNSINARPAWRKFLKIANTEE